MTLREAIAASAARLENAAGLAADAARDAQLLLLHTLSLPRTALFTDPGRTLTTLEQERFDAAIRRRLAGEPIQ